MSIPKQKFREIVFEMLYSYDISQAAAEDMMPLLMAELSVSKDAVQEAQGNFHQVLAKQSEIDALITKATQSYAFERIQSIERNVLRLGVYELLFDPSIPPKVAIAEAIRLTRKFGTPESAAFVNAVLDHIYKLSQGEKSDPSMLSTSIQGMVKAEKDNQTRVHDALSQSMTKNTENSDG